MHTSRQQVSRGATLEAQKVGPPHGVRGTDRNSCAAISNIVCCLWQPTYFITHKSPPLQNGTSRVSEAQTPESSAWPTPQVVTRRHVARPALATNTARPAGLIPFAPPRPISRRQRTLPLHKAYCTGCDSDKSKVFCHHRLAEWGRPSSQQGIKLHPMGYSKSCGLIASTEHRDSRTIRSAVVPMRIALRPVRPREATTTKSACFASTKLRISAAG